MIDKFVGEYEFLSNFYHAVTSWQGETYSTVEHAFQAAKTYNKEQIKEIRNAATPGLAKKLGRKVELRKDWEEVKYSIMYRLVFLKFLLNTDLRDKLLATNDEHLIEGNTWGDTYWGVCDGVGENNLGRILMSVRKGFAHR
jgi:ribA/ribD-fused uncharacterized protein